jgi:hypothetical protein
MDSTLLWVVRVSIQDVYTKHTSYSSWHINRNGLESCSVPIKTNTPGKLKTRISFPSNNRVPKTWDTREMRFSIEVKDGKRITWPPLWLSPTIRLEKNPQHHLSVLQSSGFWPLIGASLSKKHQWVARNGIIWGRRIWNKWSKKKWIRWDGKVVQWNAGNEPSQMVVMAHG